MAVFDCEEKFSELLSKDTDISFGRFNFPCRLRLNPEAKYLSVQLHGTVPRDNDKALPAFARWNYGKILGAHVLSICDPTLYLDDNLRLGWYLGTKDESAVEGVAAIAVRCAKSVGLSEEQIVFSGSSGGGFAALQAAAIIRKGKAIAINPQTNVIYYPPSFLQNYIEKASGCKSLEEAQNCFGSRFNAINSLREANDKGYGPRIVYVQNTNEWHYQKHFLPFADAFGLDKIIPQSVNGPFMSILYDGTKEHGPEPMDVVKRINAEAIPFLLDLNVTSQIPELAIEIFIEKKTVCANIELLNGAKSDYKYACYLSKDNKVIEKRRYQADSSFVFDVSGPGKYMCHGFVSDGTGAFAFAASKVIEIKDDMNNYDYIRL